MRTVVSLLLLAIIPFLASAGNNDKKNAISSGISTFMGKEKIESSFFRDKYLHNDYSHYLDNLDDNITYESETTGDFQLPDLTIFSVAGNSYRWNRYYLDGFRVDNRLFPGTNFYYPDMYNNSLSVDYFNSGIEFTTDKQPQKSISLRYNVGGLGGISPFSEDLVNLYHLTANQRMYKPFVYRKQMKGAGVLNADFLLPVGNKSYQQHFFADLGTRMLVGFDETGISSYYPEDFLKAQLSGDLPVTFGSLFNKTSYLCSFSNRQNLFTEYNYSREESAKNSAFNISIIGSGENRTCIYTSGITLATNRIRHNDLNFYRNLFDQDGEAFEPWYPDANTLELSHALNLKRDFQHNLYLTFDSYNSIINFNPVNSTFHNPLYAKNVNLPFKSLYISEWQSAPFLSALLENTLGITYNRRLSDKFSFRVSSDLSLDGMLLTGKSVIRPNWQGQASLRISPSNWFTMELSMAKKRIAFNFDHIRYMSSDYLNGDLYYWNDSNDDQQYQPNEKSDYFTSTGGKYHDFAKPLKQQAYFVFDLPFIFRFGKHEFSILNSYKKYYNLWTTRFDKSPTDYGYFENEGDKQIFFLNEGKKNYLVDYYPSDYMHTDKFYNMATNSPYYFSNVIKYQYNGDRVLFSFSWCSYIVCGISTLGNGPLHNNMDVFSESSANPNIRYKMVGRLDQDRALVARILLSYKVSDHISFALSGKFKDGQPMSDFNTKLITDSKGNTQLALWDNRVKGINPFTQEFGSREDAFFNIEFRTSINGKIKNLPYEVQLMMYNLYDFGTELEEYNFDPDHSASRYALELNIPRGLMITTKFYL